MSKIKFALIFSLIVCLISPLKANAIDVGNGLFAEYFQYRNQEYSFSAASKRYETSNDVVDKAWTNKLYSVISANGRISYNTLSVVAQSSGIAQSTIKYVKTDRMAVRWSGKVKVSTTKTYKFRIRGNGGAYILLRDNNTILEADSWKDNFLGNLFSTTGTILTTGSKQLIRDVYYPIVVEYMNYDGKANILLQWSSDGGTTWRNVPKNVLYSSTSNRTVSVSSLNKDKMMMVDLAMINLGKTINKEYLKDPLVNKAQDIVLDLLGPRTKKLISIGKEVLTSGFTDKLLLTIGKQVLGTICKPATSAYEFMNIFKNVWLYVDEKTTSDAVRGLIYLTLRENSTATYTSLPVEIGQYFATFIALKYNNPPLGIYSQLSDMDLYNIGRLAGTVNSTDVNEFVVLMMSTIVESYLFQFKLFSLVAY